jgi:hypothetical protein
VTPGAYITKLDRKTSDAKRRNDEPDGAERFPSTSRNNDHEALR